MDTSYRATFVALRQHLINNLKCCWAGLTVADNETIDQLASSIADVLLELSPDTDTEATHAIYADAKSIAMDVVASSMRYARAGRFGSAAEERA